MRALFIAIMVTAFSCPVYSAPIYFCKMEVFVSVSDLGLQEFEPKNFTMYVGKKEVQFSGDGWLNSEKADIVFIGDNEEWWEARAPYKFIYFSRGHLNYVHAVDQTQAFNANCEKS